MNDDEATCGKCRFWFSTEHMIGGECRIRAPSLVLGMVRPMPRSEFGDWDSHDDAFWPNTSEEQWCGEFAPAQSMKG